MKFLLTLAIISLAAFQLLSFGTLPPGASKHIQAPNTVTTAEGGDPKDFNSVKLPCNINTDFFVNKSHHWVEAIIF